MNLPWAEILEGTRTIRAGDYTTRMSTFWDDGWDIVTPADPALGDCVGMTVDAANACDMDGGERVWVRPFRAPPKEPLW